MLIRRFGMAKTQTAYRERKGAARMPPKPPADLSIAPVCCSFCCSVSWLRAGAVDGRSPRGSSGAEQKHRQEKQTNEINKQNQLSRLSRSSANSAEPRRTVHRLHRCVLSTWARAHTIPFHCSAHRSLASSPMASEQCSARRRSVRRDNSARTRDECETVRSAGGIKNAIK